MSAVTIVRELLIAHAPVTDMVPPTRVYIGALPIGWTAPAILVSAPSGGNPIRTIARNLSVETIRERVQVTVYTIDPHGYAKQEALLLACKLGPGVHNGVIGGYKSHSVESLGTNPAIPPGEDKIYERSRDFMVTFREAN